MEHELRVCEYILRMRSKPSVSFPPGAHGMIHLPSEWRTLNPELIPQSSVSGSASSDSSEGVSALAWADSMSSPRRAV